MHAKCICASENHAIKQQQDVHDCHALFHQTHNAYRTRAGHILDECKCYLGAELFCKMPGAIVTVKKFNNNVVCATPLRPRLISDEFDVYLVAELYHTNRAVCGSMLDFYKRDFQ